MGVHARPSSWSTVDREPADARVVAEERDRGSRQFPHLAFLPFRAEQIRNRSR